MGEGTPQKPPKARWSCISKVKYLRVFGKLTVARSCSEWNKTGSKLKNSETDWRYCLQRLLPKMKLLKVNSEFFTLNLSFRKVANKRMKNLSRPGKMLLPQLLHWIFWNDTKAESKSVNGKGNYSTGTNLLLLMISLIIELRNFQIVILWKSSLDCVR